MRLIAFTGLPRSGKDTAAAFLVERHSFRRLAFADPLKDAAAILLQRERWQMNGEYDFDREAVLPEWGFTTRDFLQRFGTEVMRDNFGQDFWLRHMRGRIGVGDYVITDCRFPNEVSLVHDLGGTVVEIIRPGCVKSTHISDKGVKPDHYIYNDGTLEHLQDKIDYCAHITCRSASEPA
jgi:hypothetical protein